MCLFSKTPRLGSGVHPNSYWMGTGCFLHWRQSGQCVKLNSHLHLVPRLRIRGLYVFSLHLSSWHTQGQIYGNILLPLVSNVSFCNEVKIQYTDSVMLYLPWKVIFLKYGVFEKHIFVKHHYIYQSSMKIRCVCVLPCAWNCSLWFAVKGRFMVLMTVHHQYWSCFWVMVHADVDCTAHFL